MFILQLNLLGETFNSQCLDVNELEDLHERISQLCGLSQDSYYLKSNGRVVSQFEHIGSSVSVVPKLCGGKGGFGSMLRAIGAQIEKTTNREACRDLSGRRLRDINEEQRLIKWISQQGERDKEVEEKKKKKLEKLAREPKHEFHDLIYEAERSELTSQIANSVDQGCKAVNRPVKRKPAGIEVPKKRVKTILDDDLSSDETDESDIDDSLDKTVCLPPSVQSRKSINSDNLSK